VRFQNRTPGDIPLFAINMMLVYANKLIGSGVRFQNRTPGNILESALNFAKWSKASGVRFQNRTPGDISD
jgi:hypothetical protein